MCLIDRFIDSFFIISLYFHQFLLLLYHYVFHRIAQKNQNNIVYTLHDYKVVVVVVVFFATSLRYDIQEFMNLIILGENYKKKLERVHDICMCVVYRI